MLEGAPQTSGIGVRIAPSIQCISTKRPQQNRQRPSVNSAKDQKRTEIAHSNCECLVQLCLKLSEMTNLWDVRAELKFDGDVRRIHYRIDRILEYAYPSLENILLWCKDACEKLLSELKEKKADPKDLTYVEKEIESLNEYQKDWITKHKKE